MNITSIKYKKLRKSRCFRAPRFTMEVSLEHLPTTLIKSVIKDDVKCEFSGCEAPAFSNTPTIFKNCLNNSSVLRTICKEFGLIYNQGLTQIRVKSKSQKNGGLYNIFFRRVTANPNYDKYVYNSRLLNCLRIGCTNWYMSVYGEGLSISENDPEDNIEAIEKAFE